MELLIIFGIIVGIFIIIKIIGSFKENTELKDSLSNFQSKFYETNKLLAQKQNDYNELKNREIEQNNWIIKQENIRNNLFSEIENNLLDREKAYKWLSPLVADLKLILKEKYRDYNELIKGKRCNESKVRVENLVREKRILLEENSILKYQLEYIKTLIPETDDIIEYDEYLNESLEDDSPKHYLTNDEYNQLSDTEKNIRAFDYYKKRKKRNWEIGRDFERYIGYKFEQENYYVEYFGIKKKYNDLGRDLIVKGNNSTKIIQCKYWSKNKIIHEKHIAQLFGTVAKYKIDNPHEINVEGLFVSHTILSDEAKNFANALGIIIREKIELEEYPMIKCKNGKNKEWGYGTKIYHLPMDQQYDSTNINKKKGDFYAFTVMEAEREGYRRAYKWHFSGQAQALI